MTRRNLLQSLAAVPLALSAAPEPRLTAEVFDSGFAEAHDTYNAISTGRDGRIYYVLSSESLDVGARMFVFDPATRGITALGELTAACGEQGQHRVPQGKSHVSFAEHEGALYFASHVGVYAIIDGMEQLPVPPPKGYQPYAGGHFLSYDLSSRRFTSLAVAPDGEGIITFAMDPARGRLYGLTWPSGQFLSYDLRRRALRNLGRVSREGEAGRGERYRTLCRSFAVHPADGSVYFTNGDGDILRYRYDQERIETVPDENLRKDYFGQYDPSSPGHMGYNWRQTAWHEASGCFYGVHGNSGYLFRFDPRAARVDVIDRITSAPSRRSGMFDQFSYGYLGFTLGPDGNTLHYLTGGPVYENGRRVAGKGNTAKGESKGTENLHLVTHDIAAGRTVDHGAIFFAEGGRPAYVNSIAVGHDGWVYALSRVRQGGTDLIRAPGPLRPKGPA